MNTFPDRIYLNAQIVTMDSRCPYGQALATDRGRILDVGAQDRILAMAGKSTEILDMGGRTILPGLIDAHSHFMHAGLYDAFLVNLKSPPLGRIKTMDDLIHKLRLVAVSTPGADWILGYGYDDTLLEDKRHPNATDLDRASAEHPIFISHVSGHLAALNTMALKRCGIDQNTQDPFGGKIRRDARSDRPNGILDGEPAIQIAAPNLPDWSAENWLKAVERASEMYASKGVTSAQEGDAMPGDFQRLMAGHRCGALSVKIQLYPNWAFPEELALYPSSLTGAKITPDGKLCVGGVKMYQDGSIQGYSGYLSNPYHTQLYLQKEGARYRGQPRNTKTELNEEVEKAHRAGWQVAVHANGDEAIEDVIDSIAFAQQRCPRYDTRHIIVHCQTVREDQLDRMQTLGIIPSFFTTHTYFWGDRHQEIFLGPERARRLNPCASAMARGMPFTCHNDTYITPIDPLMSVWSAVNRISEQGRVLGPEFRIPVMEALRSVTLYAAYQNHQEEIKGTLAPGKTADMVILQDNPLKVDPLVIKDIEISATIVDDTIVYGGI